MIKSIQILRGLAAWAVVFHHISQIMFGFSSSSPWVHTLALKAGNGVDIFFVISGFIIFSSVSKKTVTPVSFAVNRIARIAPAYWLYTSIAISLSYLYPGIIPFSEINAESVIKSMFFIPVMNHQIGWYMPTLTVGWTLNFEMLFYACICMSLLFKGSTKILCCIIIPLIVMNLFSWLGNNESGIFLFYNDELFFEFIIGAIIAVCYEHGLLKVIKPKAAIIIIIISLVSIIFSNESRRLLQIGVPCAAIVVACICLESKTANGIITMIAVKLGDWSYSTYLSHVIIIAIANEYASFMGINKYTLILPVICLVVLFSYLSFKWIETPFGKIGKYLSNITPVQLKEHR